MSVYRINALACLTSYAAFAGFMVIIATRPDAAGAFAVVLVSMIAWIAALYLAVCPTCRKSPLMGVVPHNEPPGRYVPYRLWKRMWPERTCSDCGRDLTQ
jgi:hypothetical protein